jgi:pimeloyl-ACP methyl ester carboxylesterase
MSGDTVTLRTGLGPITGTVDLRDGPDAVLFVHGLGSTRSGHKATALRAACARAGATFAAFDFHGHGESWGSLLDLRASRMQRDLDAVLGHLGHRLFVVGSSMGGFAASWLAARRPDRVAALALVAPAFRFLARRWEAMSSEQHSEAAKAGRFLWPSPYLGDIELSYALLQESEAFDPASLAIAWRVPALIWHGMQDEVVPWRDSVEMASSISPGPVEVRLLRSGDHTLNDRSDEVADDALRFFRRSGALWER